MKQNRLYFSVAIIAFLSVLILSPLSGEQKKFKILVVMSYDESYSFEQEMREGIEASLAESSDITYFYMNTKKNFEGGSEKAKEAFALYENLMPDGVITADDDAQRMFVVPFLKDKVKTPVMFCGVNLEPETYGFPASNVSGILERGHIKESIALAQQLVPGIKTGGRINKDSPMSQADRVMHKEFYEAAGLRYIDGKLPATFSETMDVVKIFKAQCDVVLVSTLDGIRDENDKAMSNSELIPLVVNALGKPTFGSTLSDVQQGVLCAVIQSGQEQGGTAADMLLLAMNGKPVSLIPITQNKFGRRIINVDTMKSLGIAPPPVVIRNAELVKTIKAAP